MDARRTAEVHETNGELFFGVMAAGIIVLTGLIALIGVVGEWWTLAAVFATLLATTGAVVVVISRLLDQDGEPRVAEQAEVAAVAAERETFAAPSRPLVARAA